MADNWEFACKQATGKYVAVLIDKTVLRPTSLEVMWRAVQRQPAEIVSWWNEFYQPLNENLDYDEGTYFQYPRWPCPAYYFDPRRELARRFSFNVRRGTEGVHYFWGKICFGAFRMDLINRIRKSLGRLFFPLSPDYTSMIAALAFARSSLDIGQPLLITLNARVSNGRLFEESDDYALRWLKSQLVEDPSLSDRLPIKGLYASSHNGIAADYLFMKKKIGDSMRGLDLNKGNLVRRAKEDLDRRVTWTDESRKEEQYRTWARNFSELSFTERVAFHTNGGKMALNRIQAPAINYANGFFRRRLKKHPRLRILAAQFLFDFMPQYCERLSVDSKPRKFDSIVEAAEYADKYYGAFIRRTWGR
jgi:hypothetical protein